MFSACDNLMTYVSINNFIYVSIDAEAKHGFRINELVVTKQGRVVIMRARMTRALKCLALVSGYFDGNNLLLRRFYEALDKIFDVRTDVKNVKKKS